LLYKEGAGGDLGGVLMIKKGSPDPANGTPAISGNLIAAMVDPDAGPPSILTQPTNVTVAKGETATFSVNAIGAKPLTYQWQRGGVNVPGATATNLTVNDAGTANFGIYSVVITNSLGSVTSQNANLTVTGLPTVLFIHASGGPNDSDRAIMNRLQGQGWQVIAMGASTSQTSDATGKSLVVVSSTISSGEVGDKFKDAAVPVLNWEGWRHARCDWRPDPVEHCQGGSSLGRGVPRRLAHSFEHGSRCELGRGWFGCDRDRDSGRGPNPGCSLRLRIRGDAL
jgi:hypothetical protein